MHSTNKVSETILTAFVSILTDVVVKLLASKKTPVSK